MSGLETGAVFGALKTGDLVLFAEEGRSRGLLGWLRRHSWAHIGLVLREPDDPEPLLWEARDHGPRRSPVVVRLAPRIAGAHGRVSVRRLNQPLAATQRARLDALRREGTGRAPQRGLLDLMAAADDGWLGAKAENLGEPTGAELVAKAYQRLGLLDDVAHGGAHPSGYRPGRFGERAGLELKHGYVLGPEVVLHDPESTNDWSAARPQPA
jgi:hypothetical protein